MDSWSRLTPYLWKYRRRLSASLVLGGLVSVFWSAELLLTFPVVKVFLQGEHLDDYVERELVLARETQLELQQLLKTCNRQLESLPAHAPDRDGLVLLRDQSRYQRRLNAAAWRVWTYSWFHSIVIPRLPRDELRLLVLMVVILLAVTALKGLCIFGQDVVVGSAVELVGLDLRNRLFRHLTRLDPQVVQSTGSASIVERLTWDVQQSVDGLCLIFGKLVREPVKALGCLVAAFYFNWQLTLLSLVFLPPAAWLFVNLGRRLKKVSHRAIDSFSELHRQLEEVFDSIRLVIATHHPGDHRRRFHRANKTFVKQALRIIRLSAMCGPAMETLAMLAIMAAVLPGAYLVLRETRLIFGITLASETLDIAELSVMYTLLAGMIDPLRKLSRVVLTVKGCSAAVDRVFALLDQKPWLARKPALAIQPRLQTALEFENVTFCYGGSAATQPPVLRDFSLRIAAGERVAVVGENGCGKSTLAQLLLRFFDPQQGRVLVDGVDLREVPLRLWRRQLGWAPQEAMLVEDTVRENLRYGLREVPRDDDQRFAAVLDQAQIREFLADLPRGLESSCGPEGRNLSGGQRQRIALARALWRQPSLLILDEPTSAVDAEHERQVFQSLAAAAGNATVLLITHNLTPAVQAFVTRVAVVEQGRLVAYGTQAELLATSHHYRQIAGSQSRQKRAA